MDDMTAFERQLGTVLDRMGGPEPGFDAVAVASQAATTAPAGRWTVITRHIGIGSVEGGFSMFSALKIVVAAAVVALFGGFLLSGALTTPTDEEGVPAAATASPMATQAPSRTLAPWPVVFWAEGLLWEPRDEPRTWTVYSEPHAHFPGAQEMAVGPDGRPWFWEPGGCGDPMSGEETMCAWQMGRPGYTSFPAGYWLNDLAVTDDGTLWAATERGLQSFDGETWTRHGERDTTALAVSESGSVWGFGPGEGSVSSVRFAGGETTEHAVTPAFPDYGPEAPLVPFVSVAAPDGSVWVGGGRMGEWSFLDDTSGFLARFDGDSWEPMRPLGEDTDPGVTALAAAPDGTVWTLLRDADGPYLARLDRDEWSVYSPQDGLPNGAGWTLAVGSDGTAWLTLDHGEDPDGGVVSFDGQSWARYLANRPVGKLVIRTDGTVMVAAGATGDGDRNVIAIRPEAEIVELED